MIVIKNKKTLSELDSMSLMLSGDLDKVGLDEIRNEIDNDIIQFKGKSFVLDLSELKFINSEGVGYLLTLHYRLLKRDKQLVLLHAIDHVKDVLDVIGLLGLVPYFETFELFEKSL